MGYSQNCEGCHRNRKLLLSLISVLFIISSLTNAAHMVEGRTISKLFHSDSQIDHAPKEIMEEKMVMVGVGRRRRVLIGSMPPRCDRRCSSCGHCEAIQVPIVPLLKTPNNMHAIPTIASSRGDYISNYKPICWKCKCGNFIFDP